MISIKAIFISILILCISFLHMQTVPTEYGLHILHRELFFIPIIFASFWFGLRIGLVIALIVCVVYTPLVISHGGHQHNGSLYPLVMTQLAMYLLVAALIGWLRDRQQAQQNKLIAGERATALAKAASALSFEIKDVVSSLDNIHTRASGLKNLQEERNFQQELSRLNHLVEVLTQYVPADEQTALSTDLNLLLESSYKKFFGRAQKEGVELVLQRDESGCPSMIISQSLERVLDALVDNALEVSKRSSKIYLLSKRGGSHCYLEVTDEGQGVDEADREKLFKPFFTTKPHGSGLSLSAGRKVLRDHGGDLVYIPEPVGSTFRIIVPRENIQQNIDEFAKDQGLVTEK